MLEGRYVNDEVRKPYEGGMTLFPPLLYVALGVADPLDNLSQTNSGISFPLDPKVEIDGKARDRLSIHVYNFDRSLAPTGKTTVIVDDQLGLRSLEGLERGPGQVPRREGACGRTSDRRARSAPARHSSQDRDARCRDADDVGTLHRQLARQLRRLAAERQVARCRAAEDSARALQLLHGRPVGRPGRRTPAGRVDRPARSFNSCAAKTRSRSSRTRSSRSERRPVRRGTPLGGSQSWTLPLPQVIAKTLPPGNQSVPRAREVPTFTCRTSVPAAPSQVRT